MHETLVRYEHKDGRECMYSTFTGEWYHWDHDHEPTPKERMQYKCDRTHVLPKDPIRIAGQTVFDPPCACEARGPHRLPNPECPRHGNSDRGEFGMPGMGARVSAVRVSAAGPGKVQIDNHDCIRLTVRPTTGEAIRIIGQWLPETMERFLRNNTKYARAQKTDLGDKGIMPDINRKTSVLLDRIWFGAEEVGEPTVEVIDDLIGHLFLLRDKICNKDGE